VDVSEQSQADTERDRDVSELLCGLGAVVWEFDWSSGAFTYVSEAAERLLGYPLDQWTEPGFWLAHVHPDDVDEAVAFCTASTERGVDHTFEYRMIAADGSELWIRDIVTVDPVRRMDGRLRGVLVDITDHRRLEAELAHAENRYRSMISSAQLIAGEVSADGTISFVNEAACELVGRRCEELIGQSFLDLVAERERERLAANLNALMRGARSANPVPITVVTASGTERLVRFHTSVLRALDGTATGAVVLGEDITEHAVLESMLERKAEDFDSIFRLTGDLYFRVDAARTFSAYMAPSADSLSASPEAFLGHRIEAVLPPDISPQILAGIDRAHETMKPEFVEYEIDTLGGTHGHWEARLLPLSDGGTSVIARNITARVERERALMLSEERYRHIVQDSPFGMHFFEFDDAGVARFVGANEAAAALTGFDYPAKMHRPIDEAFAHLGPDLIERYKHVGLRGGVARFTALDYPSAHGPRIFDVTVFQTTHGGMASAFTDVTEQHQAAGKEAAYQARLRAMAEQLTRTEEQERRHLAEELHDRVSQSLAVARMHLDASRSAGEDAEEFVLRAKHLLEQAIAETRTITTELAPPVLYELGLGSALMWLADKMADNYGLAVTTEVEFREDRLDQDAKTVLFRACRELLMNVVKHAGVGEAIVSLRECDSFAVLNVSDVGVGFDPASLESGDTGFGLFSIRERIPHLGGELTVSSSDGQGACISIRLPLTGPATSD